MRRFFWLALLFTLVLVAAGAAGGIALAAAAPFHPGDFLFPLQDAAEQAVAGWVPREVARANYRLHLAERRSLDLAASVGSQAEVLALENLDEALDQAEVALGSVSGEGEPELRQRLLALARGIQSVLAYLRVAPEAVPQQVAALQAKTGALRLLLGDAGAAVVSAPAAGLSLAQAAGLAQAALPTPAITATAEIGPLAVMFPPGSPGARHEFFPLAGAHANLACESCHAGGRYAGTPDQCIDCHLSDRPAPHFEGDCATCHTATAWQNATFDHAAAGATNCQSCHSGDKPANHFAGQCSACHSTQAWQPAHFNHAAAGATNCQSCHSGDKPANHFAGQCSACHNTSAWLPANFNHAAAGATDCQSCHSSDKPANHFAGQCSACHNTRDWSQAHFDHAVAGATDCQGCHSRPANHFQGQCSACHNTRDWSQASFNHAAAGATNCRNCHNPPANHFQGNCAQCHNTNDWDNVSISGHPFPLNHGGAGGNCSACHTGGGSKANCYACHNRARTEAKHADEGIFGIAGNCLNCHANGQEGEHEEEDEGEEIKDNEDGGEDQPQDEQGEDQPDEDHEDHDEPEEDG